MDPLSDVLRSVRLSGGVFLNAEFTAPWCVTAKLTAEDCGHFLAMPTQVIAYHVVTRGRLVLGVDGEPPTEVHAGEIVLLPRNDNHIMASAPGLKPVPAASLVQLSAGTGLAQISHGGGGDPTHLVCGFLAVDGGYNPLISALPSVLTLDVREGTARDWIEASVRFAAGELAGGRMASSEVMSRLSETLLVEAVRQYSATLPEKETGWLTGLKDPHVGRALTLIHRDIGAAWTAEKLAREVALSRSAFIARFRDVVGLPPIRYLAIWRLESAKLQLRQTDKTISKIAHAIGYESEEAFSRAFKRAFGLPPGRWREQDQNPQS